MEVKQSLKNALRRGTGDAIQILTKHADLDFDSEINHACLHNLAYDPQCEGVRVTYLKEVLELSKNKSRLLNNIFDSLSAATGDNWDTQQLIELAASFAMDGNKQAKKCLYERYENNLNSNFNFIETEALVEIDGFEGLCFSIEIIVKYMELNSDFCIDDSLLSCFKDHFPNVDLYQGLQETAAENQYIKKYLGCENVIAWFNSDSQKSKTKKWNVYSYDEVSHLIARQERLPMTIGRRIDENTAAKLSIDFENNLNRSFEENYLKVFLRNKYTGKIGRVIACLYSDNDKVVTYATAILSKIESAAIRLLIDNSSLDFLRNKLGLLINNYQQTDFELLLTLFDALDDEDEIHSFGLDVIEIFKNNQISQPSRLINKLYGVLNCSLCRESLMDILVSSNDISNELLQELFYDCAQDIRLKAIEYDKSNGVKFSSIHKL